MKPPARISSASGRAAYGLCTYILLPLIPAAATVALVGLLFQSDLDHLVPWFGDEVFHWHEVATFATHGFGGGHYSIEENVSTAAFSSFGTHGPGFAAVYGTVARIVGWHPTSPALFNLAAIALGMFCMLGLTRPSPLQVAGFALLTATFWPLLLYAASSMQESLHHAFAFLFGGLFYRLATDRDGSLAVRAATPALIAVAVFVRPSWALLFIPYFVLAIPLRKPRGVLTAAGAGCILAALFIAACTSLVAAYPAGFLFQVDQIAQESLPAAAAMFAAHAGHNLAALLNPFSAPSGSPLESGQRLVVLVLAGYSLFQLVRRVGRQRFEFALADRESRIHGFHVLNLATITAFLTLFYEISPAWRDFRVLAPHLLLSLVICVLAFRPRLVAAYLAVALLLGPAFLGKYQSFHGARLTMNHASYSTFARSTQPPLDVDPEGGAWDNSLLVSDETMGPHLVGLPAGIGINLVLSRFPEPIKSKHVMLTFRDYQELGSRARLEPVQATPFGILFLNLDHRPEKRRSPDEEGIQLE